MGRWRKKQPLGRGRGREATTLPLRWKTEAPFLPVYPEPGELSEPNFPLLRAWGCRGAQELNASVS